MANQVTSKGTYVSKVGGNVRRWEPASYALVAGEIGWDGSPTLTELQAAGHYDPVAVIAALNAMKPERQALRDEAAQAIADLDAYLALAVPTPIQAAAQIKRLSQVMRVAVKWLAKVD